MNNVKVMIGDLFESSAQTLVNTVNCVGIMGKGVALGFKKRFPEMFRDYVERCDRGQVKLGEPYLFRSLIPPWILNFPTKDHWRSVARLEDITRGLQHVQEHFEDWGITSLAVPPLGCGEGGLDWRVVGPTLYRHLDCIGIPVELYAPFGTPSLELDESFLTGSYNSRISSSRHVPAGLVAIVEILARIENEQYHRPVGRTTFQKLAYFATEEGLNTGLKFTRASYGPYSSDLKSATIQLVNNGLIQEEKLGRMFAVRIGPTYKDARNSHEGYLHEVEGYIQRVVDLFLRIRTTNQAEIAATVHFAAKSLTRRSEAKPTENEVLSEVLQWKQKRNPPLKTDEIALTIRNLASLRWLNVDGSDDLPLPKEELLFA